MTNNFDIHEWRQNKLLNEVEFNPKKSDLNKDGKLSDYEKKRGMAIAKNIKEQPTKMHHDALDLEENDWAMDMNDEVSMARTQLKTIIENASKLMQISKEGQQYDAWVQSKITKAADYLQSVYDYQSTEQ
jgi:hypothetical protein